jgi:hypothetical protein
VAVAEILVEVVLVRLRRVVAASLGRRLGREERGAGTELQRDVALQMNGVAQVRPRGQEHGPAAGRGGGLDGRVDGRRVHGPAVALRAEGPHVVEGPGWARRQAPREHDRQQGLEGTPP